MEASLYGRPDGFYERRRPGEDFYTAPELHPAFGRALSVEIARRLETLRTLGEKGPFGVVEAGGGDGTLLQAVSAGLEEKRPDLLSEIRFSLVERSGSARAAARKRLGGRALVLRELDHLEPFRGVLFSNELLDALPFHLLEKRGTEVLEVLEPGPDGKAGHAPVAGTALLETASRVGPALAEGERHAACLERRAWLKAAAARLERGWLITIDYGRRYPADAPVPARTYRRHKLGSDVFEAPGSTDITAPVDFEELIKEGKAVGFKLEKYGTLASFLLERGIAECFEKAGDGVGGFGERMKLKTLLHPEGMGEIFKVLIQSRLEATCC